MNLESQWNLSRHILPVWTVSQALVKFQSEIIFSFSQMLPEEKNNLKFSMHKK